MSRIAAFAAIVTMLAGLAGGCRTARYELSEPLDGQVVEVKSGDRVSVVLTENGAAGFRWSWECDDDDVEITRETIPPESDGGGLVGAPGKVRITMRFHRGYAGPSHVKLHYRRPWKGGETARTIDLSFYRHPEDEAPWK